MLADVPIIDFSRFSHDGADCRRRIAQAIEKACTGNGFFYASGHGIDLATLERVTTDFHRTLSDAQKYEVAIHAYNPSSTRNRNGYYLSIPGQKANESYCYLNPSFTPDHPCIRDALPMHEVNVWPEAQRQRGLVDYYEGYYRAVFDFSAVLLRGFALALGKPENFFDRHFLPEDTLSAVSLIRYPYLEDYPPVKTAADGTPLNFESHQDVSLITVLYQTPVPNLQVEVDGRFEDIPPNGECFLVNCGTYMEHLTNGHFPARWHRVKHINAERLSIPFFAHLNYHAALDPLSTPAVDAQRGNRPVVYGHYLQHGLRELIVSNGQT